MMTLNKPSICRECGKILYTRSEAGYLVNEMRGKHGKLYAYGEPINNHHRGRVPIRLYRCCYNFGLYHVTSKRKKPYDPIIKYKKKYE